MSDLAAFYRALPKPEPPRSVAWAAALAEHYRNIKYPAPKLAPVRLSGSAKHRAWQQRQELVRIRSRISKMP
jgi:hypothetical protein